MVALLAILAVFVLLGVDVFPRGRRKALRVALGMPYPANASPHLELPPGMFLHPGHSWAEIDRTGQLRVGLDELISRAVGRRLCPGDPS